MPVLRYYTVLELARGIRAFLRLDAGLTRDGTPGGNFEWQQAQIRKPKQGQQLERDRHELEQTRQRLDGQTRQFAQSQTFNHSGIKPENIIWILGTARTGSTWLSSMMKSLKTHRRWNEPLVGELFGSFFYNLGLRWNEWTQPYSYKGFIFSSSYKEVWLNSIRSFVLDGAKARFPKMTHEQYLVVYEPNGSIGAPWLLEALPESRMVFLVRDPRDVVASILDGFKKGGWLYAEEYLIPHDQDYVIDYESSRPQEWPDSPADTSPDAVVEARANKYLRDITSVKQAYEHHAGPKVLVRYEDLRANTLDTMKHIYSTLQIPVDEEDLVRVVGEHAWERIPQDKKGRGKVLRKATPGGWREDLTPEQVKLIETITAPVLNELYSGLR
jgi:hypothetical protein